MRLCDPKDIRFRDIAIVGTGMGGGSLAIRLASMGIRCTVIEAGGVGNATASEQACIIGRGFGLRSTRHIGLGGTTNLWHGLLAPLDNRDFDKLDEETGRPLWPFGLEEVKPFYKQATEYWMGEDFELSESDFIEHPSYFEGALSGWKERRYFQKRPLRSMRKDLLSKVANGTVDLITNCNVTAVHRTADGAYDLEATYEEKKIRMRFSKVVFAAGALETPAILLRSEMANDNIGRYLMDHPMSPLITLKLDSKKSHVRYAGRLQAGVFEYFALRPNIESRNINLMVRPTFSWSADFETEKLSQDLLCLRDGRLSVGIFLNLLTKPRFILQLLQYKFGLPLEFEFYDYYAVAEQNPSKQSRVFLLEERDKFGDRAVGINWALQDSDIAPVKAVFTSLKEKFGSSHCAHFNHEFDWDRRVISAAHHSGTCRMGTDARSAVTNSDCEVFGYSGLYVCDASLIPAVGSANLGLTITALAYRLAEKLGSDLDSHV